jgi:hypothetical protein
VKNIGVQIHVYLNRLAHGPKFILGLVISRNILFLLNVMWQPSIKLAEIVWISASFKFIMYSRYKHVKISYKNDICCVPM